MACLSRLRKWTMFRPTQWIQSCPKMNSAVFAEDLQWLKASEKSFEFWDNPEDAVYDTL